MKYHPIAVNLKGELVVVAGGGSVARRKILDLLDAGARVRVISPGLTPELRGIYRKGKLKWFARRVKEADLINSKLVIAATNNKSTNRDVSLWAKKGGILVNVVDQPKLSSFISAAFMRAGKALVTVYTDGKDPVLSRDLKNFLKERWDEFLSYRRGL